MRLILTLLLLLATPWSQAETPEPDPQLRAALKHAFAQADSFDDRFIAEVWLTDMSGRIAGYLPDPIERIKVLKAIHAEAKRQQLPISLVMGLIHTESLFDRFAVSRVGAQGLMQLMPFWKNEIGRPDDNLTNIHTNLRYGCTILKVYLDRAGGDLTEALARYNGSYGKVWYPEKVYRNQQRYRD
ncbi:lytic transglycosylase domain-containing protein [Marinobacterium arenosum]|uniref:lytic transglycosylase domain-containing protein n=1 Tax=Marinobacterium arenosum TaxID=2862496 RepID=UPI001C96DFD2|nr:lytic transglycosylase domain-containing protein [Marinobacterium arenosum]MBY4677101.1 lytic transglycosylase domain-containing protein [Marinobacterium arenosum]